MERASINDTQLLPVPTWNDPRVHLLDDSWLVTIFVILFATALPWLTSGFNLDFLPVAFGLMGLGAIHIAITAIIKPHAGKRLPLLAALHMIGVLTVGFIWLHAGGLQNPAFLLVFALPVIGAIFLSRWQPYLMALLAVVVVGAVALAEAPELRWYAPGLNAAGAWLAKIFNQGATLVSGPFPGFYAPSSYFVVLLQVFAILVFACAVAAEYLGTVFERLHAHVSLARMEAERGQELWATLIEDLPFPALLIDVDTHRILCASGSTSAFCSVASINNANLFETIRFSYPETLQELIAGAGGVIPISMIHVADRLRATEIHVQAVFQNGRRLALVVVYDKTEEFSVRAALDVTDQAALVIDAHGLVIAFNKPAQALFAGIEKGAEAARLLSLSKMPARWWEPGVAGRRKRTKVEIALRVYQMTSSALPLPGEEECIYIVTFVHIAHADSGERSGMTIAEPLSASAQTTLSNSG